MASTWSGPYGPDAMWPFTTAAGRRKAAKEAFDREVDAFTKFLCDGPAAVAGSAEAREVAAAILVPPSELFFASDDVAAKKYLEKAAWLKGQTAKFRKYASVTR